ncbi:MAG TPA: MFS transporter [Streptomyces sp.]
MSSYAAVLQLPYALRTFASALLARLSYGLVPLSVLLTTVHATGSYAVAGVVMAVFGGTVVVLTPLRAGLVDRFGPRRALQPMAFLYTTGLCAFALTSTHPSPSLLCATIALTGTCAPPLGPTMRTLWSELAPDKRLLQRAYSLDGVAEELLFVTGPVLVGVLAGVAPPVVGVLVSAGVLAVGTWGFVRSPGVRGFGGVEGAGADADDVEARPTDIGPAPHTSPLLTPLAIATAAGLALSGADLLVTAFAQRHGHSPGTAAWTLAALSAGSAIGGLVNGAVDWHTPARTRLPRLAATLGLLLLTAALAPDLPTLTAALTLAGAFISPTLTTAYLIADESSTPATRTRSTAWINTAMNAGSSAGAAATGLLLSRAPLSACFAAAGAVVLVTGAGGAWAERGRGGRREKAERR